MSGFVGRVYALFDDFDRRCTQVHACTAVVGSPHGEGETVLLLYESNSSPHHRDALAFAREQIRDLENRVVGRYRSQLVDEFDSPGSAKTLHIEKGAYVERIGGFRSWDWSVSEPRRVVEVYPINKSLRVEDDARWWDMAFFKVVPRPLSPAEVEQQKIYSRAPVQSEEEKKEVKMTKYWVQAYTNEAEDPDNEQWLFNVAKTKKGLRGMYEEAEGDSLLGVPFQVELSIDPTHGGLDSYHWADLTTDQVNEVIVELEKRLEPGEPPSILKKTWDRTKKQGGQVAGAAVLGVQLAIADQAGEALLDVAKEFGKDIPMMALLLEHPDGRAVAKLLAALSVHTLATHAPGIVPAAPHVLKAAQLSMTASSFQLLTPRLAALRKHLLALASIGEQLGDVALPENPLNALTEGAQTLNGGRTRERVKAGHES